MRIENDIKLDFSDVLIKPKRSTLTSRKEVNLNRQYIFKYGHGFTGVPIMAANMDGVGTLAMVDALIKHNMFTCLNKHYTQAELIEWINIRGGFQPNSWAYTLGISLEDSQKLTTVKSGIMNPIKFYCLDVANGYTQRFVDFVKKFRTFNTDAVIIAGNVATPEMTEELILSGADIVKVGIGPGSVCTTRIKTGIGYPQLSAIIECADAAHGLGGHIIADGGCTTSGDIAKAFGAGADFVMLGGMLAGHTEGGNPPDDGNSDWPEPTKSISFHGMSSKEAMREHNGGQDEYRASEGKEVTIPYKGDVSDTILDILGGLRSSCTYVGAASLKEISKRTTFIRVNNTHNRVYERYGK
jgi:GMP reductase